MKPKSVFDFRALSIAIALILGMGTTQELRADNASRLQIDAQCATVDGKDVVLFSGAFHYFRCPKELWADRFRKLKEAGFNTVETYAAWNYHELSPPNGPDDFSKLDMTELHDWLAMATDQFGFYVILRPGPYICAEWDGGGYPQWLLTKRPADYHAPEWYRSDDPTYLAWCKHWFTAVAKAAAPFQISHRNPGQSGIILWQIENEYDYSDQPAKVKHAQLSFLAHTTRDLGIDIPLTTCLTDNPEFKADEYLRSNVIETRNTYPKYDMNAMWNDIGMLYTYQPAKFKMITELQGGWFAEVGGKLSEQQGFGAAHINHITINAWESGFTSTNYYMGFGGTNFGGWASEGLTATYDYDAPIRECGGVTDRYFAVKSLGEFLKEHGPELARSQDEAFDVISKTNPQPHVHVRRAKNGARFIFLRNLSQDQAMQGDIEIQAHSDPALKFKVDFKLDKFGAKILYLAPGVATAANGVWYPKEAARPPVPGNLPASINVTHIVHQTDPGPDRWMPFDPTLDEAHSDIFNRDYVFYRTAIPASGEGDSTHLFFKARVVGRDWLGASIGKSPLSPAVNGYAINPEKTQRSLTVLYENAGRPNFGRELERPSGMLNANIVRRTVEDLDLKHWQEAPVKSEEYQLPTPPEMNGKVWAAADVSVEDGDLQPNTCAIYRSEFELTEGQRQAYRKMTCGRIDDEGKVYVNGELAGTCHDWSTPHSFDVSRSLHAGKNSVIIMVANHSGHGGLSKRIVLEPAETPVELKWEMAQQTRGVTEKWWSPTLNDAAWSPGGVGDPAAMLTWYRMKFELPSTSPGLWVPWKVDLKGMGNGFVFLNGHSLGRFWEAGPQHEFYLPECWLLFGGHQSNVVTVEMRPSAAGTGISSAVVEPYRNMAELR